MTATATCPAAAEYRFLVIHGGQVTVVQAYSTSSSATWSTTGYAAGAYTVEVDVRNQGSTLGYEAWATSADTLS
jgi:hypothetical protein